MVATSSAVCTNDTATASTPAPSTPSRRRRSSSVGERRMIRSSGSDTPGRPRRTPPLTTAAATPSATAPSVTTSTTPPSPSATRSPGSRAATAPSRATPTTSPLLVSDAPASTRRTVAPGRSCTPSSAKGADRTFGPGRSTRIPMARPMPFAAVAHPVDPFEGRLERSVGEAQPAHVGACLQHPAQHGGRIRCRSDGRDDLGATDRHVTRRYEVRRGSLDRLPTDVRDGVGHGTVETAVHLHVRPSIGARRRARAPRRP